MICNLMIISHSLIMARQKDKKKEWINPLLCILNKLISLIDFSLGFLHIR